MTAHAEPTNPDPGGARQAARLLVAPGGPWADALAGRVEATFDHDGRWRAARTAALASDLDEAPIGLEITGPGLLGRDLLVAPHPSALDPDTVLRELRPGSVVLIHVRAADGKAVVASLEPAQREALRAGELELRWVDALGSEGPVEDDAFAATLVDAAVAALRGDDAGAGRVVDGALLEPSRYPEEVDFRAARHTLRLPEAPADVTAEWHDAVWRFHLRGHGGLSAAAPALGTSVVPAALRELARRLQQRRPWPLLIHDGPDGLVTRGLAEALGHTADAEADPEAGLLATRAAHVARSVEAELEEAAAAPFGADRLEAAVAGLAEELQLEGDDAQTLRAEVAHRAADWPSDGRVVPLTPHAPVVLHVAALAAARGAARMAFERSLRDLADRLAEALLVDELKSPDRRTADAVASSLGSLSGAFLDPAALARQLPGKRGGVALSDERRARMTAAREALEDWLEEGPAEPPVTLVAPDDMSLPAAGLEPCSVRSEPDPLAAAAETFDALVEATLPVFAAARVARLELAGAYRPEVHDEGLATLDREGLTLAELAVLPAVLAVTTGDRARAAALGGLSQLLCSLRPIQVLVVDAAASDDDAEELHHTRVDLGTLAVAHRETFAVQSSLARPEELGAALARMAATIRPAVAVVAAPTPGPAGMHWLRASAALYGRAVPELVYDPDGGDSWADRFELAGNPAPDATWPVFELTARRGDAEETVEVAFTFADALSLKPRFLRHLRPIPVEAWSEAQLPLDEWLGDARGHAAAHRVPYVWIVDGQRALQRAIVTRELALACRDRARAWHVVQELGGHDNAWAKRAAAAARGEAAAESDAALERLRAEHEAELQRVRAETAREAMERLAAVLLELDTAGVSIPAAAPATTRPATTPSAQPAAAAAEPAAPAPQDDEDDEDDLPLGEAYIDSVLCTSCNDCLNLNPAVFQYNSDKQAFIADPVSAPFELLVKAAEGCAANCIHPGKPRDGDPTVTPELIERAKAFH